MKRVQRMFNIYTAILPLSLLLLSCSQGLTNISSTCAKLSSVVPRGDISTGLTISKFSATQTIGGYLIAYHLPTAVSENVAEADLELNYCSVGMQLSQQNPEQVLVWTAAHCIDFSRVVKAKLFTYNVGIIDKDGVGSYKINDVIQNTIDKLTGFRTSLMALPKAVRNDILSSVNSERQTTGVEKCKVFTQQHFLPKSQQVCASLGDLSMHMFKLPSIEKRTPETNALIEQLRNKAGLGSEVVSSEVKNDILRWQTAYATLADIRWSVSHAYFNDKIKECVAKGLVSEFCSVKAFVAPIIAGLFMDKTNFDPNKPLGYYEALLLEKQAKILELWNTYVLVDKNYLLNNIFVSGNFSFSKDYSQALDTINIPSQTSYLYWPKVFNQSGNVSDIKLISYDDGLLLSKPFANTDVLYQAGDSGTIIMIKLNSGAIVPIGVMSTVNGNPTSGGLATRPVVNPEEEAPDAANTNVGGADASKQNSPGSGTVVSDSKEIPTAINAKQDGC